MTKDERLALIGELEKVRKSKVLAYLTADRGLATSPMAEDVLRIAWDHVRGFGKIPQLDLMIYSRGGDAMLPWPLVNALRSLCDRFCALIPYKAHSAATLVSLGADEIVMTPIAQLTPVEPTVNMPFCPPDQTNPGHRLGINVEDAASYFEFAKERAGIDDPAGKATTLQVLASQVHPVALGNLHRMHKLARLQAEKLLGLHMNGESEKDHIKGIVENLVQKLWAHEYKIGLAEAQSLDLKAKAPTDEEGPALWGVFEAYEQAMELRSPIHPVNYFASGQQSATVTDVKLVYVESSVQTNVFVSDFSMSRAPVGPTVPGQPPQFGGQVQIQITRQEWQTE